LDGVKLGGKFTVLPTHAGHDLDCLVIGVADGTAMRRSRGSDATAPWKSQLRHHLIPEHGNRADVALRFTARVIAPQLITYWDNDWAPAPATP